MNSITVAGTLGRDAEMVLRGGLDVPQGQVTGHQATRQTFSMLVPPG